MAKEIFNLPVYETDDVTVFKKLGGNRSIYREHVAKLVKVFAKDEEFSRKNPIKVNEKMEIIDGQHRVEAYKKYQQLGETEAKLYYMVIPGLNLIDARSSNSGQKTWNPKDYAEAFVVQGRKEYGIYLKMSKEFELNHNIMELYLTNRSRKGGEFKSGEFIILDEKESRKRLHQLKDMGQYFPDYKLSSFGTAFHVICSSSLYDHERMKEQMEKYAVQLRNTPQRVRDMIPVLGMIYNWKRKDKVDLLSK